MINKCCRVVFWSTINKITWFFCEFFWVYKFATMRYNCQLYKWNTLECTSLEVRLNKFSLIQFRGSLYYLAIVYEKIEIRNTAYVNMKDCLCRKINVNDIFYEYNDMIRGHTQAKYVDRWSGDGEGESSACLLHKTNLGQISLNVYIYLHEVKVVKILSS